MNEQQIAPAEFSPMDRMLSLEKFQKALAKSPAPESLEKNKFANDTVYLPISHVEMTLDELYFGLWKTSNWEKSIVANEIVGSLLLEVFHPIEKIWISRIGVGATMIRQHKDASITDIGAKIKNALEMDVAHCKADALKNAAKSLGPRFGRDLNRKLVDTYHPLMTEANARQLAAGKSESAMPTESENKARSMDEEVRESTTRWFDSLKNKLHNVADFNAEIQAQRKLYSAGMEIAASEAAKKLVTAESIARFGLLKAYGATIGIGYSEDKKEFFNNSQPAPAQ